MLYTEKVEDQRQFLEGSDTSESNQTDANATNVTFYCLQQLIWYTVDKNLEMLGVRDLKFGVAKY